MTTENIDKAVNEEIHANVEGVAAVAAAQVDQANRDAEAIARAAVQSDHVARLNAMEEGNVQWRATMEQRLAETKAETLAALEASQASILSKLTPPPVETPPPVLAPVLVNPSEDTLHEDKPKPSPPPASKESPTKRQRVIL